MLFQEKIMQERYLVCVPYPDSFVIAPRSQSVAGQGAQTADPVSVPLEDRQTAILRNSIRLEKQARQSSKLYVTCIGAHSVPNANCFVLGTRY